MKTQERSQNMYVRDIVAVQVYPEILREITEHGVSADHLKLTKLPAKSPVLDVASRLAYAASDALIKASTEKF